MPSDAKSAETDDGDRRLRNRVQPPTSGGGGQCAGCYGSSAPPLAVPRTSSMPNAPHERRGHSRLRLVVYGSRARSVRWLERTNLTATRNESPATIAVNVMDQRLYT